MPRQIAVEELGQPLKVSRNGWTNYLCPFCADGKPQHFWVSPDKKVGMCHKCQWHGMLRKSLQHVGMLPVDLVAQATALLRGEQAAPDAGVPLRDMAEELDTWKPVSWEELTSTPTYLVHHQRVMAYIAARKVSMSFLQRAGVQIVLRVQDFQAGYDAAIAFPLDTAGAILRRLGGKDGPLWLFKDGNSGGCFVGALALAGEGGSVLHIVESPTDAIRLAQIGLRAVALCGTNLGDSPLTSNTALGWKFVIMLDADATDKALKIKAKLEVAHPSQQVQIVHIPHDPITGATRDPCDLTDEELHDLLHV